MYGNIKYLPTSGTNNDPRKLTKKRHSMASLLLDRMNLIIQKCIPCAVVSIQEQ